MSSLRSRLIGGTLIGITLFLALNGGLIWATVRARRHADVDRSLEVVLPSLAPVVFAELVRREDPDRIPPGEGPRLPGGLLVQAWLPDGTTLFRSEALGDGELDRALAEPAPGAESGLDRVSPARTLALADGASARARGARLELDFARERFRPPRRRDGDRARRPGDDELDNADDAPGHPGPPPGREAGDGDPRRRPWRGIRPGTLPEHVDVVVAESTRVLAHELDQLLWLLVLGWLTSSLGCAGILSWVVHKSLRPLDALRDRIEELDEDKLDRPIAVERVPSELEPVIEQLNRAFERLARAFEREQTLTAHAAHELRTPLAGLRATLEVALSRPRTGEEHTTAAEACLGITLRMQALVERLLEMARLDAGAHAFLPEDVLVAEQIDAAWRPHAAEAAARGIALERDVAADVVHLTDELALRRILANLLENAVHHGDAGEPVHVAAHVAGTTLELTVSSSARDADPDVALHCFEPFWRSDASRTGTGAHAGLGLALCRKLAEGLGGSIEAELADGRFVVRLALPDADAPAS